MNTIGQDLRYGLRMLTKRPGFTFVAILITALGIGASTAIFSVVNGVLLHNLPYPEPGRITMIWDDDDGLCGVQMTGHHRHGGSYLNFIDRQNQNQAFAAMAIYWQARSNLTGYGEPEEVAGATVSADFFRVMGISPVQGRIFTPEEDQLGRGKVVLLSYALWQRRFGGEENVVGKTIYLNNEGFTIVGIMPPGFRFLEIRGQWTDLWVPLNISANMRQNRDWSCCRSIGRLKPGTSVQQAQAEMEVISRNLADQFPKEDKGWSVYLASLHEQTVGDARTALLVLTGVVGFVLLIVCANVASLLLVRASARQKEFAIRIALGASRWQLVRQLLIESMLLAGAGGILGLALAELGVKLLIALSPDSLPRLEEIRVDGLVLIFSLGITLVTGVLFGLIPAWQAARPDVQEALKEGGKTTTGSRRVRRLGEILVIIEVALTLIPLIGSGLLIRSFRHLQQVDTGFGAEHVLTMPLRLPKAKYGKAQQAGQIVEQLVARLEALPGVRSAAIGSVNLLGQYSWDDSITIEGRAPQPGEENEMVAFDPISPHYFRTLGVPLRAGRFFGEQDVAETPPVVIINEALQQRYLGNDNPLGRRLQYSTDERWFTIVGVVANTKRTGLDATVNPETYFPIAQEPQDGALFLVVGTEIDPSSLTSEIRQTIWSVDRELPVANFRTLDQLIAHSLAPRRFSMLVLSLFAVVALILAMAGIYGVISYTVAQRTHEIGIRIALGARAGDVIKLVVRQGMVLAGIGVVMGIAAALALTRLMSSLLYGVNANDPVIFIASSLLLTGAVLVASFIPARRTTRIDPMVALRHE